MRDIYSAMALDAIQKEFIKFLAGKDLSLSTEQSSDFAFLGREANKLVNLSLVVEEFLTLVFPIQHELESYIQQARDWQKIYEFKRSFIERRAVRKYQKRDLSNYSPPQVFASLTILQLANKGLEYLANEEKNLHELESLEKYCAYKVYFDPSSVVFRIPSKLDFDNLLSIKSDRGNLAEKSFNHANYCIFCHNRAKDSCRNGLKDKEQEFQKNPLGNELKGCPLGQKISEMNYLYSRGNVVAALAIVMIDNPLVAATGDRICNDCMKACIYQKQEPVDIPCIETEMLKAVLTLPYGAEIYYLLSRWNPLVPESEVKPNKTPTKNLVVGLGPAGFAMSYYLLRQGNNVTAIDSLGIKPLPEAFFQPIKSWPQLIKSMGHYSSQGFGGVAEYGITDRWDKYNLLLIRMLLERDNRFELRGEHRLGKDITIKAAVEQEGYDYIALCMGAGSPKVPVIKNIDAKGVVSAFTFLASLHMEVTNFKFDMPVVIVGAGLTAIDCAMAALSYYKKLGGNNTPNVTIVYRKSILHSPSYRENHEELKIALEAGVKFLENTELESIDLDEEGHVKSINGSIVARTLIYSIGTHPNEKIFAREEEAFKLYKKQIGIFGDMDPGYAGTVVRAIASVRDWSVKQASTY